MSRKKHLNDDQIRELLQQTPCWESEGDEFSSEDENDADFVPVLHESSDSDDKVSPPNEKIEESISSSDEGKYTLS